MRLKGGALLDPETRVGNCCGEGCGQHALLFKVPDIYRYRCGDCFERETGHRHHLDPRGASIIVRI